MTQIKICCIQSKIEATMALDAGADALGLVGAMPSGPGPIPEGRIAELASAFEALTVLLTAHVMAGDIVAHARRTGPKAVQLVERVSPREIEAVHTALPDLTLIQTIYVNGPSAVDGARDVWDQVDMLLLDSGSPNKAVKDLSGMGRTHDWRISAEIVRQSPVPVWLAGGLNAQNVTQAVRTVKPHGVDVCEGLRPNGMLDRQLLRRFVAEVHAA